MVDQLVAERNARGPFQNLQEFLERISECDLSKRIVESLIKAGALDCLEGNRRQKMMIYTSIMDNISQSKKKMMAGQMSLFDIVDDELKSDFEIKFPKVNEFSKQELLAFEKEVIGLYVSGHPLEEYQNMWKKNITRTSLDFQLNDEDETAVADNAREIIGGIISEVTVKVTKQNSVMAFVTIEDLYGTVEVLVFPKLYEKYRQIIAEDNKVFITGRVTSGGEENAKMICETIISFNDKSSELWIRFENKEEYEEKYPQLLENIKLSNGKDKIVIYLNQEKAKKILPASCNVNADQQFLWKMQALFGENNVRIVS